MKISGCNILKISQFVKISFAKMSKTSTCENMFCGHNALKVALKVFVYIYKIK